MIVRKDEIDETGKNTYHILEFIEKNNILTILSQNNIILTVSIDKDDISVPGKVIKHKIHFLNELLSQDLYIGEEQKMQKEKIKETK